MTPCRKGHNIATAARSANVPSQRQRAVSALRCSCGANVQHRRQCAALAPMCNPSTNVSHSAHWHRGATACSLGANVKPWRQYAVLAPTRRLPSHRRPSPIAAVHGAAVSTTQQSTRATRVRCEKRARVFGYSRHNRRVMAPLVRRTPCVRNTRAPVGVFAASMGRNNAL